MVDDWGYRQWVQCSQWPACAMQANLATSLVWCMGLGAGVIESEIAHQKTEFTRQLLNDIKIRL